MGKLTPEEKKSRYRESKRNYDKKFNTVTIRLTKVEIEKIDKIWKALGNKSRTAYIKSAALHGEHKLILQSGIYRKIQYEARKIGVNLNQIAYNLNAKNPEFNDKNLQVQIGKLKELLLEITAPK